MIEVISDLKNLEELYFSSCNILNAEKEAHKLGDLKNQNFNELWESAKYQNFRQSILKSRKEIDICKNCSEGTKVWA